jgi:molybdate transport system ATP-binding protein
MSRFTVNTGEMQKVQIARVLIHAPDILILDGPCQGLDRTNRQRILDAIDVVGRHSGTHIIYVMHYPDEIPISMTHMLKFEKSAPGCYQSEVCKI